MNVDNIRRILRALEKRGVFEKLESHYSLNDLKTWVGLEDRQIRSLMDNLATELRFEFSSAVVWHSPDEKYGQRILREELLPNALQLITLAQELVAPLEERSTAKPKSASEQAVLALEKDMIEHGLVATGGNKTKLARKMGISRTTLIRKMEEFGISAASSKK